MGSIYYCNQILRLFKEMHSSKLRKIIHVDMDMFYAAVEMRDNPDLRNKPLVIGGKPNSRGVVCTANYEARKYGIHSAMPCSQAYRKCPHCIFLHPEMEKYKKVSRQIRQIFFEYTDLVEPMSLDEAYLDVTRNKINEPGATIIAKEIKQKIFLRTQLTASAGVAPNKFVAKIASDYNKPDGLCVVKPESVMPFIRNLPIIKIPGVGKVTNQHLRKLRISTVADLEDKSIDFLTSHLGKFGIYLFNIAKGRDNREVESYRERQSYGRENTFAKDISNINEILSYLKYCTEKVFHEFTRTGLKAKTVTLKLKYNDFKVVTRQKNCDYYFTSAIQVFEIVKLLLKKTKAGKIPIRLAGVSLSGLEKNDSVGQQMYFAFYP